MICHEKDFSGRICNWVNFRENGEHLVKIVENFYSPQNSISFRKHTDNEVEQLLSSLNSWTRADGKTGRESFKISIPN